MNDRLVFTDTVSAYAMHGVGIHEDIVEMWGCLRSFTIYVMRYMEGQHKEVHLKHAQRQLLRFAHLAQQHFGGHVLMTFQLHTCALHLIEEIMACGPSAFRAEWWVEVAMQLFKASAKYRALGHPETTATNHMLANHALADMELRFPGVGLLLAQADGVRDMSARKVYDSTHGGAWLSGAMRSVSHNMSLVRTIADCCQRKHVVRHCFS